MAESNDRTQSAHAEDAQRLRDERWLRELLASEPIPRSLEAKYRTISAVRSSATDGVGRARRRALSIRAPGMPRATVAAACAAVALVGVTLKPPGRAVAQAVGELVGIGGPPTLDHSGTIDEGGHGLPLADGSGTVVGAPEGPQVVIGSGTVPGGPEFEIVAYRTNVPALPEPGTPQIDTDVLSAEPGLALTVDFPDAGGPRRGGPTLGSLEAWGETAEYGGISAASLEAGLGTEARAVVTGDVPSTVDRIEATYVDPATGQTRVAPSQLFTVDDRLLERLGVAAEPFGYWVAFIPEAAADGGAVDSIQALTGTVEVTAHDAEG